MGATAATTAAERAARRALVAAGRSREALDGRHVGPDPDDRLDHAVALWNTGRPEEAVASLDGGDARALHALAWMHLQRGADALALSCARRAVEREPHDVRAVATLTVALLARGHKTEAEALAHTLVTLAPASASVHALLGEIAAARRDWRRSLQSFDRALEMDEHAHQVRVRRAAVEERLGRFRDAAEDLMHAAKMDPSLQATHVAPLVDRTLEPGHAAIAVAMFWGLTAVPAARYGPLPLVMAVWWLVVAAAVFVWHRRRLAQLRPEVQATYRKGRVWTHVVRAWIASIVIVFLAELFAVGLAPRGSDPLLGTLAALGGEAATLVLIAARDRWPRLRGIPIPRSALLSF